MSAPTCLSSTLTKQQNLTSPVTRCPLSVTASPRDLRGESKSLTDLQFCSPVDLFIIKWVPLRHCKGGFRQWAHGHPGRQSLKVEEPITMQCRLLDFPDPCRSLPLPVSCPGMTQPLWSWPSSPPGSLPASHLHSERFPLLSFSLQREQGHALAV